MLLHSSKDSQLVDAMLANLSGDSIMKDFKPSGVNYNLAIRLTRQVQDRLPRRRATGQEGREGRQPTKKPTRRTAANTLKETKGDNTVVLFGDADMLYDPFTIRRIDSPFGAMQMAMNANLNLAQNLVEQMTGDNNLIAVRSRATLNRPFTRVKEMEAAANEKFQSEIKRLEDSAAEAQQQDQRAAGAEEGQGPALHPVAGTARRIGQAAQGRSGYPQAPEAGAEGFTERGRLAADAHQMDQHSGRAAGGDGYGHSHRDC